MGTVVAIEASSLLVPRTGVGRFVETLVRSLEALPDRPIDVEPYVISVGGRLPPGFRRVPVPFRVAVGAWGAFDAPRVRFRGVQVVHGPNYVAPPTGVGSVVSIHDCWFLRRPDQVHGAVRLFGRSLRRAIARGVVVHVPSHHTANEVWDIFGDCEVRVVPLGATYAPAVRARVASDLPSALAGRPFVIAVATREPRKNLPVLVRAFGEVAGREPDLCLLLVGQTGADHDRVVDAINALAPDVRARVVISDFVDDVTRERWVGQARVLAFPSLDEGWGYPALEAMRVRTPVVAARSGSLPEVCGDAALLVSPTDVAELSDAIERAVADEELRGQLVRAGEARLQALDPTVSAERFADLYREVAARE